MYRIHTFDHDQIHMCDLESDLNAWTCALQLTPFLSYFPLKRAQRAGHRFTLTFIEYGSGAAVLSVCGFVAVEWVRSWFALELGNCDACALWGIQSCRMAQMSEQLQQLGQQLSDQQEMLQQILETQRQQSRVQIETLINFGAGCP